MRSTDAQPEVIRFGAFEADLRTRELRKFGTRLRVPNQSFLVLAMLLEKPGQLVTRDDLRERLWPADTFVEYDQGLNAAVNRLRDVLGDSAERPRFIETLPKRGYRFIAALDTPFPDQLASKDDSSAVVDRQTQTNPEQQPPRVSVAVTGTSSVAGSTPARARTRVLLAMACVLILIGLLTYFFRGPTTLVHMPRGGVMPLTSLPGQEVAPTFSPDGSQVAFAWSGDSNQSKGFDLYVKAIGSERMLRLTNHPARWISPAWSPDGSQIAFARLSDEGSGIFAVPALGGSERKLANAAFWYEPLMQISWSPDGKRLAFWLVDTGSHLSFLSLDTLQASSVTPEPPCWDRGAPVFSPDGKNLAFICTTSIAVYAIYVVPTSGGPPRPVASMMGYPGGMTWTRDGRQLIFSNDPGNGGELWRLSMDGTMTRLPFGEEGSEPAVAIQGGRLAYVRGSKTVDIWRLDLAAAKPEHSATKLLYSTHIQRVPQYSPDGTKIVFESNRSGTHEIWLADGDGNNPVQITSFNGPLTGGPSWCSDGRQIAFDSRASGMSAIYVEDIEQRLPRRVEANVGNLALPAWSPDCRSLFASDGHQNLYQVPLPGGVARRATEQGSYFARVVNQKVIFNVKKPRSIALWSKPVNDGTEAPLEGMPELPYTESWTAGPQGIYYTDSMSTAAGIFFYDFASRTARRVSTLPQKPASGGGLSVSPDGRWLLFTQTDDQQSDIMLVEGFK